MEEEKAKEHFLELGGLGATLEPLLVTNLSGMAPITEITPGGAPQDMWSTEKVRTGTFGGHTVEQSRFSATTVCRMCLALGANVCE